MLRKIKIICPHCNHDGLPIGCYCDRCGKHLTDKGSPAKLMRTKYISPKKAVKVKGVIRRIKVSQDRRVYYPWD
jgi:predicted amidophosphoribosyltransferase